MRPQYIAIAMLLTLPVLAQAKLPVTHVLMFSDRAEIERQGRVAAGKGVTRVDLEGLPWAIETSSIRAMVSGKGARIERTEVEPVYSRLIREEEAAKLNEDVAALKAMIHDLEQRGERLRQRRTFMGSFEVQRPPHDPDDAPPRIDLSPNAWTGVLSFVEQGMTALSADLIAVNRAIEAASLKLEILTTRLDRLVSKDVKQYKNVAVFVQSDTKQDVEISVTYLVMGPQWFPRYEVRADTDTGKVRLIAHALVRQQTGEDWLGAKVTFSTVDLGISSILPPMPTTRISPAGLLKAESTVLIGKAAQPHKKRDVKVMRGSSAFLSKEQSSAQRVQLNVLQASLTQQRDQLVNLQNNMPYANRKGRTVSAGAQSAGQDVKAGADAKQQDNPYAQIRWYYKNQKEALNQKDYNTFADYNGRIQRLWKGLPQQGQTGLAALNNEAVDNGDMAQRLLKSRELEKNLQKPSAAVQGVDYRFEAMGPANIYSEWVLTKIRYMDIEIPAEFVHEAAPVHKEFFYLIANARNPLDRPLLPGPSAIFMGPDFVGESTLRKTSSGSGLRFELGVDRDVQIARRVERVRDTRGFLLRKYHYSYTITISAVNHKATPVKALIFDRRAYADKKSNVTVSGFDADPSPNRQDRHHLMRWDLELKPGEKKDITFAYELSYRNSLAITGSEGGQLW